MKAAAGQLNVQAIEKQLRKVLGRIEERKNEEFKSFG